MYFPGEQPAPARLTAGSNLSRRDFPMGFVFGTSTSAFQCEGAAAEEGRGPSIWDIFTKTPGRVEDGTNANVAVDTYHRYKEDVKIMKKIGLDAYKFSISWSRVLPGGKLSAGVNQEGIKYYNDLIDTLLANGIEPYVTLFHWDLPLALEAEYGGFLSSRIVYDFREFAELCFWEFGDRVKHWITVNDPWGYSIGGYLTGTFPPGRGLSQPLIVKSTIPCHRSTSRNPCICSNGSPGTEPYIVSHLLLLAHATAVDLYRKAFQGIQKGEIGISLVSNWFEPLNANELDEDAAARALDFMLGWFLEPLKTGRYPQSMRKLVGSRLPQFSPLQSKMLKGSYDFLGLNYYTASYVTSDSNSSDGSFSYATDPQVIYMNERVPIGPKVASDWLYIYPQGIYKLLLYIKKIYNIPCIYVTENGIDETNDPKLVTVEARVDDLRIKYHQDHLAHIMNAIRANVNVKGYFIWSLLDNFDWCKGYTARFGLIHVDFKYGLKRYPKNSALWLMNFLSSGLDDNAAIKGESERRNGIKLLK